MEVHLDVLLTLSLDGVYKTASRSGRFTTRERTPGYNSERKKRGLRRGVDAGVKRKK
jgi:hypothetical protein